MTIATTPRSIADLQTYAGLELGHATMAYVQNFAGDGKAFQASLSAYNRWDPNRRPTIRRSAETPTIACDTGFADIVSPIMDAPTAFHNLYNRGAEKAMYDGAHDFGTFDVISSFSSMPFADIGASLTSGLYQILMYRDPTLMMRYINRAVRAGCKGIVVTIDALKGCSMCRVDPSQPAVRFPGLDALPLLPFQEIDPGSNFAEYYERHMPGMLDWGVLAYVVANAGVPVILKGVLTSEEVTTAIDIGTAGVIVSNHGGRQNDDAPGTLDALASLDPKLLTYIPVFLDGGIRTGEDVFKALALGARAVLIGRPAIYGLAYDGADGVKLALQILSLELQQCMLETGCNTLADITRDTLIKKEV